MLGSRGSLIEEADKVFGSLAFDGLFFDGLFLVV